jgi:hypothetical protein
MRTRLMGSGGVGTGASGLRELSLTKRTLAAFLVGISCVIDVWLVDTGVYMHIINNIKWFKKESLRSLKNCSMDISTAPALKAKGADIV